MKRFISVLLGLSMVLALAGCTKEETTKKPKKTKDEKETSDTDEKESSTSDDTETEPTDTEPSDTEPTDTEPTDTEPTETSDVIPTTFTIAHTLENLELYSLPNDYGYAAAYTEGDRTSMMGVSVYCDDCYFDVAGYDALEEALDQIFVSVMDATDEFYEKEKAKFIEDIKDGKFHTSKCWICNTIPFRADSKVCSFEITGVSSEEDSIAPVFYNIRSDNGEMILFDDVVTDRAAFADFIESYLLSSPNFPEDSKSSLTEIVSTIRHDEIVDFTLGFDGIFLFDTSDKYFKVPVHLLDSCVSMEFFGNTPEDYTLVADDTRTIEWDVDEDGVLDTIRLDLTFDEYDFVDTMTLWFNNEKTTIPSEYLTDDLVDYDTFYLMRAGYDYYLYITYSMESVGMQGYAFVWEDGNFEFLDPFEGGFRGFPYDPESFLFNTETQVMGTGTLFGEYNIGGVGLPQLSYGIYEKSFYGASRAAVTKVDLEATEIVDLSGATGDTITIPAGTVVYFQYIDTNDTSKEVRQFTSITFATCEEEDADVTFFKVVLETSDLNSGILIGGIPQDELFDGLQYAG